MKPSKETFADANRPPRRERSERSTRLLLCLRSPCIFLIRNSGSSEVPRAEEGLLPGVKNPSRSTVILPSIVIRNSPPIAEAGANLVGGNFPSAHQNIPRSCSRNASAGPAAAAPFMWGCLGQQQISFCRPDDALGCCGVRLRHLPRCLFRYVHFSRLFAFV